MIPWRSCQKYFDRKIIKNNPNISNMNDFKDIAYLEIMEDMISDEYITPSVICTKDMPFAHNIRLAAVSVNVVLFSET